MGDKSEFDLEARRAMGRPFRVPSADGKGRGAVELPSVQEPPLSHHDALISAGPSTNPRDNPSELLGAPASAQRLEQQARANNGAPQTDIRQDPRAKLAETLKALAPQLRALDPVTYDTIRKDWAKAFGVRVSTLDELRTSGAKNSGAAGKAGAKGKAGAGATLSLWTPEPWLEPVDAAQLLDQLASTFERYVVLPEGAKETLALWVMHTHAIKASDIAPRLAITSPEMRCGKSTLINKIIANLTPRPLAASSITSAAIFRTIESTKPTLLIDEADSFLRDNRGNVNNELRGILNSGHDRDGAFVVRCVGDDHESRRFSTFTPMVVAMIGDLPGTLRDRSINIRMRRKKPGETVRRFTRSAIPELRELARKSARWAADNLEPLTSADPEIPDELDDRAADNWRPLLAIADRAGGRWPARARETALRLSGTVGRDVSSMGTMLLADVREQFAARCADRLPSAEICRGLKEMEGRPWAEYKRGQPISPPQLARLLAKFGIAPATIRTADGTPKGYKLKDFEDVFERYLPACGPIIVNDLAGAAAVDPFPSPP